MFKVGSSVIIMCTARFSNKICTFFPSVIMYVYTVIIVLNLNLLTTTIFAPPSNASKWQMGFNSAFKGLNSYRFARWHSVVGRCNEHELCSLRDRQ